MLWLEMTSDPVHGGGEWGFARRLWCPKHKKKGSGPWIYWENLLKVRSGDIVIHLRGEGTNAEFVGYSTLSNNGHITFDRPPEPGEWRYDNMFYRADLKDYIPFREPILLANFFSQGRDALLSYYERNKARPAAERKTLFFNARAGRIQIRGGAYLSEVDDELAGIILGFAFPGAAERTITELQILTSMQLKEIKDWVRHKEYLERVRGNFGSVCCFPGCPVHEDWFLVGTRIVSEPGREERRDDLDNSLSFCLMHDRAFELGLFTIDSDYRIVVNKDSQGYRNSIWCMNNLMQFDGLKIRVGETEPSLDSLKLHWRRFGFKSLEKMTQGLEDQSLIN